MLREEWITFDHPAYSNDYWREPTWLNTAYFAGKGLCCDHFSWSCVFINEFILNF